jgi:hypothetical protein
MGLNLVALRDDADKTAAGQAQGTTLRWQEVLALVESHGRSSDPAEAAGVAR